MGVSAVLSAVFGVMLGIAAAWRRRTKTDYAVTGFTMGTYSMPDFWLGMILLTVFAVGLGWFPVGGIDGPGLDRDRASPSCSTRPSTWCCRRSR